MPRYKLIFSLFAILTIFWACSDDYQSPTESTNIDGSNDFTEQLAKGHAYAEFKVELKNLTPATGPGASQPLSPPVMATHTPLFHIFKVYSYSSDELRQIAEDAVNGPMLDMLGNSPLVYHIEAGSEGPVFPQTSQEFIIKTKLPFKKFSLVSMLVNTNDAFVGIDGARLPLRGTREFYLKSYDAGTEKNTESKMHIPGPCCGNPHVRVPTHERIKHHPGIMGNGDLDPSIYGWDEPTAKLIITRIK